MARIYEQSFATAHELSTDPEQTTIRTIDGHDLHIRHWPSPSPRGAVVVVHGYAEHGGRYQEFSRRLNAAGFDVWAHDHRGHGRSGGERAFVRKFDDYVDDFQMTLGHARDEIGDKPVFVFGHSMGGLIAALHTIEYGPRLAGLVLSSIALILPEPVLMQHLAVVLGRLAPRLPAARLNRDHLSRDPEVVRAADTDPHYYRGPVRARLAAEMIVAGRQLRKSLKELTSPLLVIHGTSDRITDPDGTRVVFREASSTDKSIQLYPGLYHETVNELEKDKVYADLTAWLSQRCHPSE